MSALSQQTLPGAAIHPVLLRLCNVLTELVLCAQGAYLSCSVASVGWGLGGFLGRSRRRSGLMPVWIAASAAMRPSYRRGPWLAPGLTART